MEKMELSEALKANASVPVSYTHLALLSNVPS